MSSQVAADDNAGVDNVDAVILGPSGTAASLAPWGGVKTFFEWGTILRNFH
jgi:hypothetical protein